MKPSPLKERLFIHEIMFIKFTLFAFPTCFHEKINILWSTRSFVEFLLVMLRHHWAISINFFIFLIVDLLTLFPRWCCHGRLKRKVTSLIANWFFSCAGSENQIRWVWNYFDGICTCFSIFFHNKVIACGRDNPSKRDKNFVMWVDKHEQKRTIKPFILLN